jgi:hypothetical protein
MTDSRDDQGRPNCDACKFKRTGKSKAAYFGMDPCRKGHSVFFTCCVTECGDFKVKDVYVKEGKDEKSRVQQKGN